MWDWSNSFWIFSAKFFSGGFSESTVCFRDNIRSRLQKPRPDAGCRVIEAHTLFTIKTAESGDAFSNAKKHIHIVRVRFNQHASQPSPCGKMQRLGSLPLAVNTHRMDIRCHQTRRHSRCQSQSERMTGCREDSAVGIDCFPVNLSPGRPYVRKVCVLAHMSVPAADYLEFQWAGINYNTNSSK